jgi:hypothetical protein
MAKNPSNPLVTGLTGKIGNVIIFKTVRGKTVISAFPRKPDKSTETKAQKETRTRFKIAAAWASAAMKDPKQKKHFEQVAKKRKLPNAYTAALQKYLRGDSKSQVQSLTAKSKANNERRSSMS